MKFATSINCIDGRVQLPVTAYIKEKCAVDYVDTITIPGCDGVLAGMSDGSALDWVRRAVEISVTKHGSRFVYVSGHYDCAANPVERRVHIEQIKKAIALIKSWKLKVRVFGLWVGQTQQVEEIGRGCFS